jgi:hypothetical protein
MNRKTARKIDILQTYVRENFTRWVEESGGEIVGAHIGLKKRKRRKLRYYSIVFHVQRKRRPHPNPVPERLEVDISGKLTRVPTDVISTGGFRLFAIQPGHRAKNDGSNEMGSIGFFLTKNSGTYLCSNMHVLAPAHLTQKFFYKPVAQQYQTDIQLFNVQGQQARAFLEKAIFNGLDAAIARLQEPSLFYNYIPETGLPSGQFALNNLNSKDYPLQMYGGKSGMRKGKVLEIRVNKEVKGVQLFPLIKTNLFSEHGDSGSPVFNANRQIIGIIVGGDNHATYVLPTREILEYFEGQLFTGNFS